MIYIFVTHGNNLNYLLPPIIKYTYSIRKYTEKNHLRTKSVLAITAEILRKWKKNWCLNVSSNKQNM